MLGLVNQSKTVSSNKAIDVVAATSTFVERSSPCSTPRCHSAAIVLCHVCYIFRACRMNSLTGKNTGGGLQERGITPSLFKK